LRLSQSVQPCSVNAACVPHRVRANFPLFSSFVHFFNFKVVLLCLQRV
jgi:hypothetical protein